jgi:hypothetical protein
MPWLQLSALRQFVTNRLADRQGLLSGETAQLESNSKNNVSEIPMVPQYGEGGEFGSC